MIRSLHVKNFKCLRDVQVELEPLTVLIGENDTGKSSLLEAIRVLAETAGAPSRLLNTAEDLQRRVSRPSSTNTIEWTVRYEPSRSTGSRRPMDYRLCLQPAGQTSNAAVRFSLQDEVLGLDDPQVAFTRSEEGKTIELRSLDGSFGVGTGRGGSSTILSQLAHQNFPSAAVELSRTARSVELFRFDPTKLAQAVPAPKPGETTTDLLRQDGSGLPAALDLMVGAHNESFLAIQKDLSSFSAQQIRAIKVIPGRIENGPDNGKRVAVELQSRQVVDFREVSNGIRLALAFFTLLHAPDSPDVVMIEEPENGIHPRALASVVEALKQLTRPRPDGRQVQVLLTTHSPYLLDYVPAESVRVFGRRKSGDSFVQKLLDLPGVKERISSGYSLGEMWFNVGERKLLESQLQ